VITTLGGRSKINSGGAHERLWSPAQKKLLAGGEICKKQNNNMSDNTGALPDQDTGGV